jgi:L-lactate dehydrogenase complex protein LldE
MRVSLFIPCLVDQFAPEAGVGMVKVLKKLGIRMDYPSEQTCCGQPAFNTGYRREAKRLAERFIRIFKDAEYIVAPSGSCVAMVKVFYPQLDIDPELQGELDRVTKSIYEFSEFLVNVLGVVDLGARLRAKVTYHDACHLLRELNVRDAPRHLIQHIRDVEFVESDNSDVCCGFGGTFSVKYPEISAAMAEEKIQYLQKSGAEYIIANDTSCLMQIAGMLSRKKISIRTVHLAELLGGCLT